MYTMTFYANPHGISPNVTEAGMSYRGGLPFAVWSEGTGPVVLAQHVDYDNIVFAGDPATIYSGVFVTMQDGTTQSTAKTNGIITSDTSAGYSITQPLGLATKTVTEGGNAVKVPTYGNVTYDATYTEKGYTIEVTYVPTDAAEGYTDAYIILPIFSLRTGAYYTPADNGTLHSVITQSQDQKTLNYRSTGKGAYGSMNIHSSTAAIFDETKHYGSYGKNVIQELRIPLDNSGKATITFEIVE